MYRIVLLSDQLPHYSKLDIFCFVLNALFMILLLPVGCSINNRTSCLSQTVIAIDFACIYTFLYFRSFFSFDVECVVMWRYGDYFD